MTPARPICLSLPLALLVAACGAPDESSGPGEPPPEEDPGAGSDTLQVNARVEAASEMLDLSEPDAFVAALEVEVRRQGGEPVADARVTITSDGGSQVLSAADDLIYRGTQAGYRRVYTLDVEAGDDFLAGVTAVGPDIHTFVAPELDSAVPSGQDVAVEWDRSAGADRTTISTTVIDPTAIEDTGRFVIPADSLAMGDGRTSEWVHLTRENQLVPEGAGPDSSMSVGLTNSLRFHFGG